MQKCEEKKSHDLFIFMDLNVVDFYPPLYVVCDIVRIPILPPILQLFSFNLLF